MTGLINLICGGPLAALALAGGLYGEDIALPTGALTLVGLLLAVFLMPTMILAISNRARRVALLLSLIPALLLAAYVGL